MIKRVSINVFLWGIILLLAIPFGAFGQKAAPPASTQLKQEELDQMLAPIALYPDSLLVQILMASTYPLEIVQASRWVKANQNLKGDQLTAALEKQDWDPSVKSLVNFQSVLAMMNDKLDWTQKLGDAFLAQQKDVMNTVQKLRAKAQAQGTLKNTDQQKITTQAQTIIIEPADPQVIYIPGYNPAVVYGTWWYPAYPPYPYYPPGAVVGASAVSFGLGVAVGAAWGYAWGGCNWNHGTVNVNVNQNNSINNNINRSNYVNKIGGNGHGEWKHDPDHRKGVAYKDANMQHKYGQPDRIGANARQDYRGHTPDSKGRATEPSDHTGMKDNKGASGHMQQADSRQKPAAGAFDGMNHSGSEAKTHSERGQESCRSMSSARAVEGAARSSGGGAIRGGGHHR
jgi:hypothetical protein